MTEPTYPRCEGSGQPARRAVGRRGQCAVCGHVLAMKKSGVMWDHKDFRKGDEPEAMTNEEHAEAIAADVAKHATALIQTFAGRYGLFSVVGTSTDGQHGVVVISNEAEGCEKLLALVDAYHTGRTITKVTGEVTLGGAAKGETH